MQQQLQPGAAVIAKREHLLVHQRIRVSAGYRPRKLIEPFVAEA
jgi:hypothetical protein